jgi:hypothetical protein
MRNSTETKPPRRRTPTVRIDGLYRRARKTVAATEDQALNALCDARLKEPRLPLLRLLEKLGHELEK